MVYLLSSFKSLLYPQPTISKNQLVIIKVLCVLLTSFVVNDIVHLTRKLVNYFLGGHELWQKKTRALMCNQSNLKEQG